MEIDALSPLYDFECINKECETKTFEEEVKLNDLEENKILCPECNQEAKRLISPLKTRHGSWSRWNV